MEILEAVHRRLGQLERRREPWPEALREALSAVQQVVEQVAPGLLSGVRLPPQDKLLQDAKRLRRGEAPEDAAYTFWLHQALRLIPWPEEGGDDLRKEEWAERCPTCGGFPDVGYLDAEGRRFHVCAFCDTGFRALRLACPYCKEDRAEHLAYYEEGPYRVYVCRSCGERFVVQDLRLKAELDLPALRARAAWYALAEEEDVEV
ncbi:MAG: formate dehydrogenase accessory protein FdhE [Thermus sp.]|uniref:formate dehydrogenase accessory protein FdhE domain-containing protein n=1 Tax=Thermus sp. TaxID=275 RepID=UPI003919AA04